MAYEKRFFMTFKIIINHIFPENFIEPVTRYEHFPIFSVITSYFHQFFFLFVFLKFTCYKEAKNVTLQQMMSVFFHFQPTLNRLRKNGMTLY